MAEAENILSHHLGPQKFIDFSCDQFDWFVRPLSEVYDGGKAIPPGMEGFRNGYRIVREATKILSNVNLAFEGVIEAIGNNGYALIAIVTFR